MTKIFELRDRAIKALEKIPAYRAQDELAQEFAIVCYMQGWCDKGDDMNEFVQKIVALATEQNT